MASKFSVHEPETFFYRRTRKSVKNFLVNHSVAKIFQRENFWGQGPSEPPRTQVSEYLYERGVLFDRVLVARSHINEEHASSEKKRPNFFWPFLSKGRKTSGKTSPNQKRRLQKKLFPLGATRADLAWTPVAPRGKKDFSAHTSEKILTSLDK